MSRFNQLRYRVNHRDGVSLLELLVTASVLMTIMTFVTTLCFQVRLVWRDIDHQRVALSELSNQLDVLTRLSPEDAEAALASLEPAAESATVLRDAKISGQLSTDDVGSRVDLQISWKRRFPGPPIILSGWIIDSSSNASANMSSQNEAPSVEDAEGGAL